MHDLSKLCSLLFPTFLNTPQKQMLNYWTKINQNSKTTSKQETWKYLQSSDSFFIHGLHLGHDIIIQPEDGDRNPGAPFVPEDGHPAFDGDRPRPPRLRSHRFRGRLDDGWPIIVQLDDAQRLRAKYPEMGRRDRGRSPGDG